MTLMGLVSMEFPDALALTAASAHKLGRQADDDAAVPSLTIGDFELRDVPVRTITVDDSYFDVVIGHRVLAQFTVTLDGPGKAVYLEPNSAFGNDCRDADVGFATSHRIPPVREQDRGVHVTDVHPDSPASRAGMLAGDRLIAIEGLPAELWTPPAIADWFWRNVNREVKVTVRRGEQQMALTVVPETKR
ncbi:MAG: hypothetical protein GIKADHBN_03678 [Phycisphaerales bacterium]|nr:hypothetical protein [Phycisphaerales bacterium]